MDHINKRIIKNGRITITTNVHIKARCAVAEHLLKS